MNIKCNVKRYDGNGGLKGFASITIDNAIAIRDLTIRESSKGLYVTFPSKKLEKPYTDKDGREVLYQDIVYPITKEARQEIIEAVLNEYNGVQQPQQGFYPIDEDIESKLPF